MAGNVLKSSIEELPEGQSVSASDSIGQRTLVDSLTIESSTADVVRRPDLGLAGGILRDLATVGSVDGMTHQEPTVDRMDDIARDLLALHAVEDQRSDMHRPRDLATLSSILDANSIPQVDAAQADLDFAVQEIRVTQQAETVDASSSGTTPQDGHDCNGHC